MSIKTVGPFDIPRFVRPRDERSAASDGYLKDPEGLLGPSRAAHVLPFERAFERQCSIILGEPGIGKSTAFAQRRRSLPPEALVINLAKEPLLTSSRFLEWQQVGGELRLVLDSLDETFEPSLVNQLSSILRKADVAKLKLEVACRTNNWPKLLDAQVASSFGVENVGVFVLEPFRRRDVADFAIARGVSEPEEFLRAVSERDLQPLAAAPLTLDLLLTLFCSRDGLPADAAHLYDRGCLHLCGEHSLTREAAQTVPRLDAVERLQVAEWLAASSLFSGLSAFCIGVVDASATTASLLDLARLFPTRSVEDIRDTLSSGLFTTAGSAAWVWRHQAFAEYLAARWLHCRPMATQRQILAHPEEPDELAPALYNVAAWMCSIGAVSTPWIAERMPELLLSAASLSPDSALSESIARGLLRRVASEEASEHWFRDHQLQRCKYPGIVELLRGILRSPPTSLTQPVAIDIAEAVGAVELADDLARIAGEAHVQPHIRAAAVAAIRKLHPSLGTHRGLIHELAATQDRADRDENIRAEAIRAIAGRIPIEELLTLLTPPTNPNLIGNYHTLPEELLEGVAQADVEASLRWVQSSWLVADRRSDNNWGQRLLPPICRHAVGFADDVVVMAELAACVAIALRNDIIVFQNDVPPRQALQERHRRSIAQVIVRQATKWPYPTSRWLLMPHAQDPFVVPGDMDWLIEQRDAADAPLSARWGDLIAAIRDQDRGTMVLANAAPRSRRKPLVSFSSEQGRQRDSPLCCAKRDWSRPLTCARWSRSCASRFSGRPVNWFEPGRL